MIDIRKKITKNFFPTLPDGISLLLVLGFFESISRSIHLLKIKPIFLAPRVARMIKKMFKMSTSFIPTKNPENTSGKTNRVWDMVTRSKANLVFLMTNIKIY